MQLKANHDKYKDWWKNPSNVTGESNNCWVHYPKFIKWKQFDRCHWWENHQESRWKKLFFLKAVQVRGGGCLEKYKTCYGMQGKGTSLLCKGYYERSKASVSVCVDLCDRSSVCSVQCAHAHICVHIHKHCGYMLSLAIYWTWEHKSVAASHLSIWNGRNSHAALSPLDYAISNSEISHLVFTHINSVLKFILPKECPPLCLALHYAYVPWKESVGMRRDRGVWKIYVLRKYKFFRFWGICMYEILCQHIQLSRGIFQEYFLPFFAGETSW